MTDIFIKSAPDANAELAVVTSMPRSIFGENHWEKITWHRDPMGGYVARREPAEAPPEGRVQVIPAVENLEPAAINYILGEAAQRQEYAKRKRQSMSDEDIEAMAQKMWDDWNNRFHDHVESKTAFLQGKTVSGPGGLHQREKPGIQNWNGVNPR